MRSFTVTTTLMAWRQIWQPEVDIFSFPFNDLTWQIRTVGPKTKAFRFVAWSETASNVTRNNRSKPVSVVIVSPARFHVPSVDPCQGIQDSLGLWIPSCGFRIPATGFQSQSVELGFWIAIFSGNPDSLNSILALASSPGRVLPSSNESLLGG